MPIPDRQNMTQKSSASGSKEQRRHARQATLQTAHIRFGEGAAIPCEIRDYCPTGLYVAFPGEATPDAALPALAGTPVQMAFSVGNSGTFRFNGWVARVNPGGVGVFVSAMPEDALQALRTASERHVRADFARAGSGLAPQQVQALQQECASLFRSLLDAVMQEFFQRAAERLGEAGQDEPGFLERSNYDYAAQELTQRRSRIEDDFFRAMRDRIKHVGPLEQASAPRANGLSLVGEAEFEDWLNLSAVIKQIELDFTPQLYAFEQRYSRLVGQPIDRKNNPFGPEAKLAAASRAPFRAWTFPTRCGRVSIRAWGRRCRAMLQPAEPVREKTKPAAAADTHRADSGKPKLDLAEIAATLDALYKQDQAGIPLPPDRAEYSLDRILATLNASPRAASGTRSARARFPGSAPAGQAAARPEVLHVVGGLTGCPPAGRTR